MRETTANQRKRDSAVMTSSEMPSAKYSCAGSPFRLANGRTAIEGLRTGSPACASAGSGRSVSDTATDPAKRYPTREAVAIHSMPAGPAPRSLRNAATCTDRLLSSTKAPGHAASMSRDFGTTCPSASSIVRSSAMARCPIATGTPSRKSVPRPGSST
ncbi:MAG: hypothetical protein M5U30_09715 [Burkholderiaceae bacterium]|nr:hypothetical protein [Burkholderiaceae bacterium]